MSVLTASKIKCSNYTIFFNDWDQLSENINGKDYSKVICIVDDNTQQHCLPILEQKIDRQVNVIIIKSGEKSKTIDTCTKIWQEMMHLGADRHSLVITLGGGVVGDMGGFCAATYMRGIAFVHVPTTLLSQVDSAVGGKLGVDLNTYKNMIGLSVLVKHGITEEDPLEQSIRKKLNFGHTIGHAVESENLKNEYPLLHGEAIAIGMICECHISYQKGLLSQKILDEITQTILDLYARHPDAVKDIEDIISHTRHDKKNKSRKVRCTLLTTIGNAIIDQEITEDEMQKALIYYSEV